MIRLPVRQYVAVPSGNPRGLVTETWELPVAEAAFVELHCWNVGMPGGLPVPDEFWVFMGSKQNHERAARVVAEVIAPCLQAARQAGLATVHVQPESIAWRHPNLCVKPPKPPSPRSSGGAAQSHAVSRARRVHGEGYMEWEGWDNLDVAPAVAPHAGDVMAVTTEEFHEWLRERGITTLIYTGFATNLCILDSPCAMKAMNALGYRCVLLREGTMAVEFPDQPATLHTEAALRYIEAWVGYTASADDFLRACRATARA
jgi:nicotinamidase-related amidase